MLVVKSFVLAAIAIAAMPSWAVFKCTVDGRTSFQEQPCADARGQTSVRTQYEADKIGAAPAAVAPRASLQQQSAIAEKERLAIDMAYRVRDKQVQLRDYRLQCDTQVRALADNRKGFNDNVAGATRANAESNAATAHATNCGVQAQALQSELDDLRRQCTAMGCKPL